MLSTAIPTCRSVMITSRVHFISSGALCSLLSLRASKILRATKLLDAFSGTTNRSITAYAERESGTTPHDVINGKWALAATHIEYKDSDLYTGASDEDLVALERRLGYTFKNRSLLRLALLHRSAAEPNNTSLAWVGDAALQFVVTEGLAASEGAASAKTLTDMRMSRVSRECCAQAARALGLHKALVVGKSIAAEAAERQGKKITKISADAVAEMLGNNVLGEGFEAVLGAIYVDGGLSAVRQSYTAQTSLHNDIIKS